MVEDLSKSLEYFKKNEYILRHFFRSKDPELRNEITIVKENLDSHHKQFKTGVIISIIAVPVTILGIFTTPGLVVVGGIASLVGSITIIDSDKWFGEKRMNRS